MALLTNIVFSSLSNGQEQKHHHNLQYFVFNKKIILVDNPSENKSFVNPLFIFLNKLTNHITNPNSNPFVSSIFTMGNSAVIKDQGCVCNARALNHAIASRDSSNDANEASKLWPGERLLCDGRRSRAGQKHF